MSDLLNGCRVRVAWAEDHLNTLKHAMEVFGLDTYRPFTIRKHFNVEESAFRFAVKEVHEFPTEWSLMIGDICHNARAALNHLAWVLVGQGKCAKTAIPESIGFPICSRRTVFDSAKGTDFPGIGKKQIAILRKHQPYILGDGNSSLAVLQALNNVDKHRHINVVHGYPHSDVSVRVVDPVDFEVTGTEPGKALFWCICNYFYVDAELTIVRGRVTGPNPDVKVKIEGTNAVMVRNDLKGWIVPDIFSAMLAEVTTIIGEVDAVLDAPPHGAPAGL